MRTTVRWFVALAWIAATAIAHAPAAAADRANIAQGGTLRFAIYKDFAPFLYATDGRLSGIDVTLAEALAAELGVVPAFLPFDAGENMNDDLRNMVWRGTLFGYGPADVMLHVPVERRFMQANERARVFAPYYREEYVLVFDRVRLQRVESVSDLLGHAIAAEQGTAAAAALFGAQGGALRERVRLLPTGRAAMDRLLSGDAAAALVTRAQAESAIAEAGREPGSFGFRAWTFGALPQSTWPIGMAVKSDNHSLAQALESALAALARSGRLRSIFEQHGVSWVAP
jgi:polar amino acid transport system substrate-binding protein